MDVDDAPAGPVPQLLGKRCGVLWRPGVNTCPALQEGDGGGDDAAGCFHGMPAAAIPGLPERQHAGWHNAYAT